MQLFNISHAVVLLCRKHILRLQEACNEVAKNPVRSHQVMHTLSLLRVIVSLLGHTNVSLMQWCNRVQKLITQGDYVSRVQRSLFFFFGGKYQTVDAMASRRPLSARNVDHTQGRGKPKKERHPFALLDRATLVQNLRHLTKDSSFPVNVCEDDLLKPTVSVVTLIIICSNRGIVKLPWKYSVVCPFGMSSIYKSH